MEPVPIPPEFHELLDGPHTGVIAVTMTDGAPQASPVWFLRDGDELLVSSRGTSWRARHLRARSAVSFTLYDPANPMSYVEVRGRAVVEDDPTAATRDAVCRKHGYDDGAAFDPPGATRVTIRITPYGVFGR